MKRILGTSLIALALVACSNEPELNESASAPTPPAETPDAAADTSEPAADEQASFTVTDAMAGS